MMYSYFTPRLTKYNMVNEAVNNGIDDDLNSCIDGMVGYRPNDSQARECFK